MKLMTIVVTRDDEDGAIIVSDDVTTVYGAGATVEAALEEYMREFAYHRQVLERHDPRLGPGLARELARLREMDGRWEA